MLMRSLLSGWTRMPASPPHCLISVSPSHSPPCSSCCLGRPKGSCPEHIQPRSILTFRFWSVWSRFRVSLARPHSRSLWAAISLSVSVPVQA